MLPFEKILMSGGRSALLLPAEGRVMKVKKTKKSIEKRNPISISIGYAGSMASVSVAEIDGVSGDTAISCSLPDGSQALILSDGMGKGASAAAESRLVVNHLRRLLKQGVPVSRAIKEVNRYLLEKAEKEDSDGLKESFATVDLVLIDRMTGRGKFYKMGAAPSYVVRGRKVRKVEKPALPVGIVPALKLTHITAKLSRGDFLVMMSDGILDSDREDSDGSWVISLLSDAGASGKIGPRQLAADILQEAHRRYGGRETDDATVVVAIFR